MRRGFHVVVAQADIGAATGYCVNCAKLEAGTDVAEPLVQKEYDTFMTDSKGNEDEEIQDIEHKTAKKQNETQTLTTKDSENTQKKHGGDGSLLS